jgi:hypothetical protein
MMWSSHGMVKEKVCMMRLVGRLIMQAASNEERHGPQCMIAAVNGPEACNCKVAECYLEAKFVCPKEGHGRL